MIAYLRTLWHRSGAFLRRQRQNFKIMLVRRALHSLGLNLTDQYNSIYAVALGADPVQLGSVLSVGNAVAALVTVPAGWLIDRYSLKKVILSGTVLLMLSALCYAVAPDWRLLYAGIGFLYMSVRITCTSCTVIGARELRNEERATARGVCRTLSALVALLTPMLAAWLVRLSGGISVGGIRPLYYIQLAVFCLIMTLLLVFVRESRGSTAGRGKFGLSDFSEIFRGRPVLVRVLLMLALMDIPFFAVLLDAALRLPLLASVRETLDLGSSEKSGKKGGDTGVPPDASPDDGPEPGDGDSCKLQ